MKTLKTIAMFSVLLLSTSMTGVLKAQEYVTVTDTARFSVIFKVNDTKLIPSYMNNAQSFANMHAFFQGLKNSKDTNIVGIFVESASSPEGPYQLNQTLSKGRAASMKAELAKMGYSNVSVSNISEDWKGAIKVVEEDGDFAGKDYALAVMRGVDGSEKSSTSAKNKLATIDGGKAWAHIRKDLFKPLRRSNLAVVYTYQIEVEKEPVDTIAVDTTTLKVEETPIVVVPIVPAPVVEEVDSIVTTQNLLATVSTNLLYDMILTPNVTAEIPIGNRFSVLFNHVFPWFKWGPYGHKYCWEILDTGFEGRYWLGDLFANSTSIWSTRTADYGNSAYPHEPLNGFFAGLYASSGRFDIQYEDRFNYRGSHWNAGVTFGWSKQINWKALRGCNFEISAKIGYLQANYTHYVPSTDYEFLFRDPSISGRYTYIGPTGIKASLHIPIYWNGRRTAKEGEKHDKGIDFDRRGLQILRKFANGQATIAQ